MCKKKIVICFVLSYVILLIGATLIDITTNLPTLSEVLIISGVIGCTLSIASLLNNYLSGG